MSILRINRLYPRQYFEFPTKAFGITDRWNVFREEDARALKLTEIDINSIRLETVLDTKDTPILLDAMVFDALQRAPYLIPDFWKQPTDNGHREIYFEGTRVINPGHREGYFWLRPRGTDWTWGVGFRCNREQPCGWSAVLKD